MRLTRLRSIPRQPCPLCRRPRPDPSCVAACDNSRVPGGARSGRARRRRGWRASGAGPARSGGRVTRWRLGGPASLSLRPRPADALQVRGDQSAAAAPRRARRRRACAALLARGGGPRPARRAAAARARALRARAGGVTPEGRGARIAHCRPAARSRRKARRGCATLSLARAPPAAAERQSSRRRPATADTRRALMPSGAPSETSAASSQPPPAARP